MKLPRPKVPMVIQVQVALRQVPREKLNGCLFELAPSILATNRAPPRQVLLAVLLRAMFGDQPTHLDHDPPLMLRDRTEDGGYFPEANDPNYLIWRTKEEHRLKTYVRGDGAQLSDAGKRRKEIKRRKKATRPKRKWPSRPMRRPP